MGDQYDLVHGIVDTFPIHIMSRTAEIVENNDYIKVHYKDKYDFFFYFRNFSVEIRYFQIVEPKEYQMGFKGRTILDAGYIWAPYVPVYSASPKLGDLLGAWDLSDPDTDLRDMAARMADLLFGPQK